MKKLLIATNILLLGIILYQARAQKDTSLVKYATVGTYNYDTCRWTSCKDYSSIELEGLIEGQTLQDLSKSYAGDFQKSKLNYNPCLYQPIGKLKNDALWTCFDLEKIKNLIWHIEHAVCKSDCDLKLQLGIRFYYIKYDTSRMLRGSSLKSWIIQHKLVNKHSLAMIPVYNRGGEWHDFDYTQTIEPHCMFDSVRLSNPKLRGIITMGSGDNHGGVGPPPNPGTYPTN